jgi:hypothetical protein
VLENLPGLVEHYNILTAYQSVLPIQNIKFIRTAILLGLLDPEDEGTVILYNTRNHMPNNTE